MSEAETTGSHIIYYHMSIKSILQYSSSQPFWYHGLVSWKTIFFTGPGVGDGFEGFKCITLFVHYISIITTSVPHQAEG